MTDQQQPPSGAVPPVPPSPAYAGPPPAYAPQPPQPPQAPTSGTAPAAPAYPAPAYPGAQSAPAYPAPAHSAAAYPGQQPTFAAGPAAPPGAYQVPVGGYAQSSGTYLPPAPLTKASSVLGILALIAAVVAAVVVPIVAGVAGFEIGRRIPGGLDTTDPEVLAVLSPARDQVLWAEISFWAGTLLGIAAIVLGIIAIRRKQGRGAGIAAIVVAALGPVVFWVVLLVTISTGTAAGFLP